MRELLSAAAARELARELEKKERGNLAWWNQGCIVEGPRPKPSPEAARLLEKWVAEDRERLRRARQERAQDRRAA